MSHFTEISGFPNPQTHSLQLSVPDSHPKKPLTVYPALLTQLYANASYEASTGASSDDGTLSVQLTIRPLNILTDNYDTIQTYVHSFNEKNASFAYANLTEEAYYDTYLDGILTILESHLADMDLWQRHNTGSHFKQNDGGLYTISEDTLTEIQNTILPWPEAEMQQ